MLAQLAEELPTGSDWTYEVKWDGYRCLAEKDGGRVVLHSRNQSNFTKTYPSVASAVATARADRCVLDGEIVALAADGRPSFQALQHRSRQNAVALVYYAFDILSLNGKELMREPLERRRETLRRVAGGTAVLLSEALPGTPSQIERELHALGLEGVVAKRSGSRYEPGLRTGAWTKVKFQLAQEFVIGGVTVDDRRVDALVVGYYEKKQLRAAGKVRAGLTPRTRLDLYALTQPLKASRCPFANLPNSEGRSRWGEGITAEDMASITWLQPRIVVQIAFTEWTADGNLRHARFLGVRDDVDAKTVRFDRPPASR